MEKTVSVRSLSRDSHEDTISRRKNLLAPDKAHVLARLKICTDCHYAGFQRPHSPITRSSNIYVDEVGLRIISHAAAF